MVDSLTYAQYASVLKSGLLSLDALARIIRHDRASDWTESNESAARVAALQDCQIGKLPYKKNKRRSRRFTVRQRVAATFKFRSSNHKCKQKKNENVFQLLQNTQKKKIQ